MTTFCSTTSVNIWRSLRGFALAVCFLAPAGCDHSADRANVLASRQIHTIAGETMGTTFRVMVVADSGSFDPIELGTTIEGRLDQIDGLMSHYRPDSELVRFNRTSSTLPYPFSPETLDVVEVAGALSRTTDGAFDITIGPLVDAWGFGPPGQASKFLDDATIEKLQARVGYRYLELDRIESTLRKLRPDLTVDLSAIAKGYAVDALSSLLSEEGIRDYLIEIGGELRVSGLNENGKQWRIAIEYPAVGTPAIQRIVTMTDVAVATSGEYRNFYNLGGVRVSHTIDPRTGRPVTHRLLSVTVLADECMLADARATALEVLGPEEGYALANTEGWAALFVINSATGASTELESPAFSKRVGEYAHPNP